MSIDPTLVDMGARLAQMTLTNASAAVYKKIQAFTVGRTNEQIIIQLRDLIDKLLAERTELVTIARAYEEQVVSQRISDDDINYIIKTVIPALKQLIDKTGTSDPAGAKKLEEGLDVMAPLLSAEMLKVLQLIGFNIKQAIGEPLTLLLRNLITSRALLDPQTTSELNRLNAQFGIGMLEIAKDEEESKRFHRMLADWRGPVEATKQ